MKITNPTIVSIVGWRSLRRFEVSGAATLHQAFGLARRPAGVKAKEFEELEIVAVFLRDLERRGLICRPYVVHQGDSPDFCVQTEGKCIGLEVTKLTTEAFEVCEKTAERQKISSGGIRLIAGHDTLATVHPNDVPALVLPSMVRPQFVDEETILRTWSISASDRVKEKTERLRSGVIHHFDEDYLCLWDKIDIDMTHRLPSPRQESLAASIAHVRAQPGLNFAVLLIPETGTTPIGPGATPPIDPRLFFPERSNEQE